MKKPRILHNFYKSEKWQQARSLKILSAKGLCERCGKLGNEVHHKKHLTIDNINIAEISLSQNNLELLCRECHNQHHNRFSSKQSFDEEGNLIN